MKSVLKKDRNHDNDSVHDTHGERLVRVAKRDASPHVLHFNFEIYFLFHIIFNIKIPSAAFSEAEGFAVGIGKDEGNMR